MWPILERIIESQVLIGLSSDIVNEIILLEARAGEQMAKRMVESVGGDKERIRGGVITRKTNGNISLIFGIDV